MISSNILTPLEKVYLARIQRALCTPSSSEERAELEALREEIFEKALSRLPESSKQASNE